MSPKSKSPYPESPEQWSCPFENYGYAKPGILHHGPHATNTNHKKHTTPPTPPLSPNPHQTPIFEPCQLVSLALGISDAPNYLHVRPTAGFPAHCTPDRTRTSRHVGSPAEPTVRRHASRVFTIVVTGWETWGADPGQFPRSQPITFARSCPRNSPSADPLARLAPQWPPIEVWSPHAVCRTTNPPPSRCHTTLVVKPGHLFIYWGNFATLQLCRICRFFVIPNLRNLHPSNFFQPCLTSLLGTCCLLLEEFRPTVSHQKSSTPSCRMWKWTRSSS